MSDTAAIISTLGQQGLGMGFGTLLDAPLAFYAKQANQQYLPNIPDISPLIAMRIRGEITHAEFQEWATQNGWPTAIAERLYRTGFNLAGVQSTITRFRRGELTKTQAQAEAEREGVGQNEFEKLLSSSLEQLSAQDLIRLLVREVFTPDIRQQFKLDAEYPEQGDTEAARIGVPSKMLKDLWAAHWELPSISAFNEMLYRFSPDDREQWEAEMSEIGVDTSQLETTLNTGRLLYRVQDVMPFWRERMIAIAYRTMTRVDVRRMVRTRQLNFRQTLYQFRKQGYSPADARRLVHFSFLYESLPEWIEQLKSTQINLDQIRSEMNEWHIPKVMQDDVIRRKLLPVTQAQIAGEKDIAKNEIRQAFIGGLVERLEAIEMLKTLNYTEDNAKFLIELWLHLAQPDRKRERDLSRTQLEKLYELNQLTRGQLKARLIGMGYSDAEAEEIIFIKESKMRAKAEKEAS